MFKKLRKKFEKEVATVVDMVLDERERRRRYIEDINDIRCSFTNYIISVRNDEKYIKTLRNLRFIDIAKYDVILRYSYNLKRIDPNLYRKLYRRYSFDDIVEMVYVAIKIPLALPSPQ